MVTIEAIAKDFASRFEGATRPDGTSFRRVQPDHQSEALTDLIREAHDGVLPDDWKYRFIEEALDAIAEDGEDAEMEPSVYYSVLTDWLHSHNERLGYCDEAMSEYGMPSSTDQLLQWGMAQEQREVLASVLSSLQALADASEEAEDYAGAL